MGSCIWPGVSAVGSGQLVQGMQKVHTLSLCLFPQAAAATVLPLRDYPGLLRL